PALSATLAGRVIPIGAYPVWLEPLGSSTPDELTRTVRTTVPADIAGSTCTVTTRDRFAPAGSESIGGQVTVCPAAVQPLAEESNRSPAGSTSLAVTPVAVPGPSLPTVYVNEVLVPAATPSVPPLVVMPTSACGPIGLAAAALLLPGSGSLTASGGVAVAE